MLVDGHDLQPLGHVMWFISIFISCDIHVIYFCTYDDTSDVCF